MIGVVNNLTPLVTVVLAFLILKERIKLFEILMLLVTVSCVIVLVVG